VKYLYNPPFLLKKIFSDFYWETSSGKILLTFDDGPLPETTVFILKELSDLKIKSLFFCIGNNLKKYPTLFNEIISEGHAIGNHTFNHKKLTELEIPKIQEEIDMFNNYVKENFNSSVKYFRPPYGKFNLSLRKILKEKKMKNVMWSLLTYDYKNDYNLVKFAVMKYLKQNSIIVLHDSLKSKNIIVQSINFIFEEAEKRGFQIGEPSECLN
jgi:peptidoglycan-N-acetylglucosamine deacetylase